jgi:anti-sigma factor RsiW
MTHDEARLLIGATPGHVSSPLAEHLAQCPECTQFQLQMQQMDRDLARLFDAPLAPGLDTRVLRLPSVSRGKQIRASRAHPRLLALAASVVLSVGLGTLLWSLRPEPSLAAQVVNHVALEPDSWSEVTPMTATATAGVLAAAGVSLDRVDTTVTYARTCLFNGHWVPHLIVRTASGPVTVMVLSQEHIASRQSFHHNGYSGTLIPGPTGGTLAVIAQGDADTDAMVQILGQHLHWTH